MKKYLSMLASAGLLATVPAGIAAAAPHRSPGEARIASGASRSSSWVLATPLPGALVSGEQLVATGVPLTGGARRVTLQRRASSEGSTWSTVVSATTTRRGVYHLVSLAPDAIGMYQYRIHVPALTVRSAGRVHRYAAWTSAPKTEDVTDQTIGLDLPSTAPPGSMVQGSVTVSPNWTGERAITIQVSTGGGPWSDLTQFTESDGSASFEMTAPDPLPGTTPVTESVRAVAGEFQTVPAVTSDVHTLTADPGPDTTPPPIPTGLSVVQGDQQVTLSWTADTTRDLAGYTVYESAAYDGPWTQVNSSLVNTNSYTVTGLTNNTPNFFTVTASNTSGAESAKSSVLPAMSVVYKSDWAQISAGVFNTCGLRTDGTVWCWGETYPDYIRYPVEVGTDNDWTSVSSGYESACALKVDHTLWCWGDNGFGQLGDGTQDSTQSPVQVGSDSDWISVSSGSGFTCGMRSDHTAWCWGSNISDLAGGRVGSSDVPVQVGSDSNWASISAGVSLACGLHTDGSAWCWGSVADTRVPDGSLGDGRTLASNVPLEVSGGDTWESVATDGWGACGVMAGSSGSCWGQNWSGQLGTGTTDSGLVPTILDPDHYNPPERWLSIQGGGGGVTCGIRTDHTLWCWGGIPLTALSGTDNYIGNGTASGSSIPVEIGSDNDWVSVSGLGGTETCGLRSNGTAWCWGESLTLGNNPLTSSLVPARVAG